MKQTTVEELMNAFVGQWNASEENVPAFPLQIKLLALREVREPELPSSLAVAATWASAFAVDCSGALSGSFLVLLKTEDSGEIEKRLMPAPEAMPKTRTISSLQARFQKALKMVADPLTSGISFGGVAALDLTAEEHALAKMVKDVFWMATCTLTMGAALSTEILLLFVPGAPTEVVRSQPVSGTENPAGAQGKDSRFPEMRSASGNLERLLEVELELVVRFGLTHVPLREVVRYGIGSIIELNRMVDEPVELLAGERRLARGTVVVIDGYYGVRITEIEDSSARDVSLVNK